jgi:hypothetical protein
VIAPEQDGGPDHRGHSGRTSLSEPRYQRGVTQVSEANAIEVVVGWMDAMRRGDLTTAGQWFDP